MGTSVTYLQARSFQDRQTAQTPRNKRSHVLARLSAAHPAAVRQGIWRVKDCTMFECEVLAYKEVADGKNRGKY
jgi:hypothetical protein